MQPIQNLPSRSALLVNNTNFQSVVSVNALKDRIVTDVALKNLQTDRGEVSKVAFNTTHEYTILDKWKIFKSHFQLNTDAYVIGSLDCVALLVIVVAAVFLFPVIKSLSNALYEQMINGMWIIVDGLTIRQANYFDYLYETLSYYGLASTVLGMAAAYAAFYIYYYTELLVSDFKNHLQFSQKLHIQESVNARNNDQFDLANEQEDEFILDPITARPISISDISAPRFIRVQDHVICLDTCLKQLILKGTHDDKLVHPLEDRNLSAEETEDLLEQLSSLLAVSKVELLESFKKNTVHNRKTDLLRFIPRSIRDQQLKINDEESFRIGNLEFV